VDQRSAISQITELVRVAADPSSQVQQSTHLFFRTPVYGPLQTMSRPSVSRHSSELSKWNRCSTENIDPHTSLYVNRRHVYSESPTRSDHQYIRLNVYNVHWTITQAHFQLI